MAQVKQGDTVDVHYTGKLDDGTVFDTSRERDPLHFTVGEGKLIPDFEQAVVGMQQGESKTVAIPAEKAYGPHRDDMVIVVERDQIPKDMNPEVGDQLQIGQPSGGAYIVTVTDVNNENITLDANHPLAGEDLTFDIEVVGVK